MKCPHCGKDVPGDVPVDIRDPETLRQVSPEQVAGWLASRDWEAVYSGPRHRVLSDPRRLCSLILPTERTADYHLRIAEILDAVERIEHVDRGWAFRKMREMRP